MASSASYVPPIGKTHSAIYHRSFPSLKRVNFPWRVLTVFAALQTWLFTTPWLVLRKIAPAGFQTYLADAERTFFEFATPIINFWQDFAYKVFSFADYLVDSVLLNGYHFVTTAQRDIGNIATRVLAILEHRVSLLQDHGLEGLWMVLKAGTSPPRYVTPGTGVVETVVTTATKAFQPTTYSASNPASYVTSH